MSFLSLVFKSIADQKNFKWGFHGFLPTWAVRYLKTADYNYIIMQNNCNKQIESTYPGPAKTSLSFNKLIVNQYFKHFNSQKLY